ncbi:MAG: serine hydrolase [Rubrivivax sp.]
MARALRRAAVALPLLLLAALLLLALRPPDLVRLGAMYTAKIVCSGVFVAGRDAQQVLEQDVQAPGHPLLRTMQVGVDREARTVRAGLFGVIGDGLAVARDGTGCASVPDGDLARAQAHQAPAPRGSALRSTPWPEGDGVDAPLPALNTLLADPALAGPGARALLVLHRGRIVAERYASGFDAGTPLLGWSMSKTVNAALLGTVLAAGRLDPNRRPLFGTWAGDTRREIGLDDLMSMSGGLAFDESYGAVTDVTRMLYLEPDMAAFAAARPAAHAAGRHFSYSSGSSVLLARLWQDAVSRESLGWPRTALFAPLGMTTAVLEADARGSFVGSSYLYASARDWARFALLLLQDGRWQDQALLPPGWVQRLWAPSKAAPTEYSQGQMWMHGPRGGTPEGQNPDAGFGLPADTRWMLGHDGQSLALVPSRELAVLRLGLTPSRLGWKPQPLLREVLRALPP